MTKQERQRENIHPQTFILLGDKSNKAIGLNYGGTSPENVIDSICNYFGVTREQMTGNSRLRQIVQARQIAMYLIYNYNRIALKTLGAMFNRDHSTVIYAKQAVQDLIETDKGFRKIVNELTSSLC